MSGQTAEPKPFHPPALSESEQELEDTVILELTNKGYSTYQIAKHFDKNQSTIWRRQQVLIKKNQLVKEYITNRIDVFAYQQLEEIELQALIRQDLLSILRDDTKSGALSDDLKRRWYETLNNSTGTKIDKEMLIQGKSGGIESNATSISRVHRQIFDKVGNVKAIEQEVTVTGVPADSNISNQSSTLDKILRD